MIFWLYQLYFMAHFAQAETQLYCGAMYNGPIQTRVLPGPSTATVVLTIEGPTAQYFRRERGMDVVLSAQADGSTYTLTGASEKLILRCSLPDSKTPLDECPTLSGSQQSEGLQIRQLLLWKLEADEGSYEMAKRRPSKKVLKLGKTEIHIQRQTGQRQATLNVVKFHKTNLQSKLNQILNEGLHPALCDDLFYLESGEFRLLSEELLESTVGFDGTRPGGDSMTPAQFATRYWDLNTAKLLTARDVFSDVQAATEFFFSQTPKTDPLCPAPQAELELRLRRHQLGLARLYDREVDHCNKRFVDFPFKKIERFLKKDGAMFRYLKSQAERRD